MVLEQKIGMPKYYFAEGEQTQEVKSITRWRCVVSLLHILMKSLKLIYGGVGHK